MLVAVLILVARGAGVASTPSPTISGPAALASGSVPVGLAISLNLSGLHPTATTGALECGAVAQTRDWVDAHRDSLIDYDSVYRWVLSTAHYYGQKALLEFPIASRSYTGTLTFSTAVDLNLAAGQHADQSLRAHDRNSRLHDLPLTGASPGCNGLTIGHFLHKDGSLTA